MAKKVAKKRAAKEKAKLKEQAISSYDRWITYICYAILVFLPLAFSRISFDQFDGVKLAIFRVLVLVAVLLWLAKILKDPENISWSWREGLLAGFLVIAAISTVTSIHIPTSLNGKYKRYEGLLTYITYFSVYFVAMQTFRRKAQLRTLIGVVSMVGGVVAFYGIMQYLGLDPVAWGTVPFEVKRSFSTFGNPDLLAGYLVIALPCAIVSFLDINKWRWLHGVSAFLVAVCLLTALTRSGWLGALVALIFLVALLGRSLKSYWRQAVAVGLAVAIVLGAMIIFSANSQLDIASKFKGAFQLTSGTAQGRFEIWKAGYFMVRDRPLFGQGPGTFRLASEHFETHRYVQSVAGGTVSDNAHNYFLQLAAGSGPLAAVLLYVFFFAWVIRSIKVRREIIDTTDRLMVAGAIAGIAGYLTTMMLGISIVGASSSFWLIMAAVAGYTRRIDPAYNSYKIAWSQELKLVVSLAIALITLASALISASMYAGDIYFVKALRSESRYEGDLAVSQFNTAARLYPGNGRIMAQLGQTYVRWSSEAVQRQDDESFELHANQAVNAFTRAQQAEPLEVDYQVFTANSLGLLGRNNEALEVLDKALKYRPYSLPANLLKGRYKERLGQDKEAIKYYKKALDISPRHPEALKNIAEIYKKTGQQRERGFLPRET
ncbi:MAG TPA: tetratricopeptide repeat protein [Actinobacteria bacterium]|nr:tetratricopeptide repeat protein [Actinomycetota bacterium]